MKPHHRILGGCAAAFIFSAIALIVTGCTAGSLPRPTANLLTPAVPPPGAVLNQVPPARPSVVGGAQIYAVKCQACHGIAGRGDGPRAAAIATQGGVVANLVSSASSEQALPSDWFNVVTNGRIDKLMPPFAQSLTPQDRWDVLSYVWAMAVPSATLQTDATTYAAACQSCHGSNGKGSSANAPDLSSLAYLAGHSLQNIADAMITGTVHQDVKLSDQQRLNLARYIRTFAYQYADATQLAQAGPTGAGTLQIHAANMTPNGASVAGLRVTLHTYDTTGEVFSRTATLNPASVAVFDRLPVSDSLFYQADLVYNGARFFAAPVQFSGTQMLSATLPVYEVTTDPGVISISAFHFFVQGAGENTLSVVEFYVFNNNSDRAYISQPGPGGQLRSLKVTLPAGATNLRFNGPGLGARFFQDGQTIYDSDAVPPGQGTSTIVMLYDIPYSGGRQIQRLMPYAVKSWDVLLPDNVLRVTDMTDMGLKPTQSASVRYYVPAQPSIAAGGNVTFNITGQLQGAPVPGSDNSALAFGGVTLLAAIAGSVILVARMRTWRGIERDIALERKTLLRTIADLDAQHAAGKVADGEYRSRRQALKDELREIWD